MVKNSNFFIKNPSTDYQKTINRNWELKKMIAFYRLKLLLYPIEGAGLVPLVCGRG